MDVLILPSVQANSSHHYDVGLDCGKFQGLPGQMGKDGKEDWRRPRRAQVGFEQRGEIV